MPLFCHNRSIQNLNFTLYSFMNLLLEFIISYNKKATIMPLIFSVSILSLLVVFSFIALLHCYARLFLARRGGEGDPPPPVLVVPPIVSQAHHLLILRHLLNMDSAQELMMTSDQSLTTRGLDPRVISSIPVFVLEEGRGDCVLECVICLSLFGGGEMGRRLKLCGHAFHVACIDMWLHSHTTCPVCRAPAVSSENDVVLSTVSGDASTSLDETSCSGLEVVVEVPSSEGGLDGTCKV